MELKETQIKWIIGLSNGETIKENEGIASSGQEFSPWWSLQNYIKENDLKITSLYLAKGNKHFNLPSIKPKFKGDTPIGYNCLTRVATDSLVGSSANDEYYRCAEAIYKDFKVQLYVDELDDNKAWVNIVRIE